MKDAAAPLKVCFHAPLLWPLWSGGRVAFTGGAEVQQARLARGLAARGVDMTVVTCDYGQPSPTTVHGVRVRKTYALDAGWPVLRFFHPRLTRTMRSSQGCTVPSASTRLTSRTMSSPFKARSAVCTAG